jgi:hypothetical protein
MTDECETYSFLHNQRRNRFANDEMGEGDNGWNWVIKYWDIMAQNPSLLEGLIVININLEGEIMIEKEIEGVIELDEELEGMVGLHHG